MMSHFIYLELTCITEFKPFQRIFPIGLRILQPPPTVKTLSYNFADRCLALFIE